MTQHHTLDSNSMLSEQIFCTIDSYKALTQSDKIVGVQQNKKVIFNDVYQLVKGNSHPLFVEKQAPIILNEINQQFMLRKVYSDLLARFKFAESGSLAAASTGELYPERETEQFTLKFKRDKSYPTQIFALLSIAHPADYHNIDNIPVHILHSEAVDCVYFPALYDGCSQLLLEETDDQFKLLSDAQSLLYLM